MTATEELLEALERAGVNMDELARLSTEEEGLFVVERPDWDKELAFRQYRGWPEDDPEKEIAFRQSIGLSDSTEIPWRWQIWGRASLYVTQQRMASLAGGWEPDVASMVAKVLEFLKEAP